MLKRCRKYCWAIQSLLLPVPAQWTISGFIAGLLFQLTRCICCKLKPCPTKRSLGTKFTSRRSGGDKSTSALAIWPDHITQHGLPAVTVHGIRHQAIRNGEKIAQALGSVSWAPKLLHLQTYQLQNRLGQSTLIPGNRSPGLLSPEFQKQTRCSGRTHSYEATIQTFSSGP